MSRRRRFKGRDVHGILLLDKPTGLTSNDVLQKVKRIYNAAKAGHTGALDPLATGMLPICLGEATKFSQYLLEADKRYEVTAKLGERTNTSDSDGEVVSTRPVNVAVGTLIEALDQFRGPIMQVPSMYSALKHNGRPLYEYAREGIEIEREARPITVFELKLISFEGDEVKLEVHCSKGTYIRSLVDDLGEVLGCGAHIASLRRLWVDPFRQPSMHTLEQLQARADAGGQAALEACLLPLEAGLAGFPRVDLGPAEALRFGQGQRLRGDWPQAEPAAVFGPQGRALGLARVEPGGRMSPQRLFHPAAAPAGQPPAVGGTA